MIYTGYRSESMVYRRVRWCPGLPGHMDELEEYDIFTGGSIELSDSSDLGASGSLDFVGEALPNTHDLVRVYYRFADEDGNVAMPVLGTFFPILSDPTHDMGAVSGSVNLQSVLRVAKKAKCPFPWNVPRYTEAVPYAVDMLEGMGIATNAPRSAYKVGRGVGFDFGTEKLEVANSLLASAGFAKCAPDAMGGVVISPAEAATQNRPLWTFEDGELSIMKPEVTLANDAADTPNAVHLRYQDNARTLWASAYNDDQSSPASRIVRGYEDSYTEEVSEIAGGTWAERLQSLEDMAVHTLIDQTQGTEYVEFEHPWVPVTPGSPVAIDYKAAGILWIGRISTQKLSFSEKGLMVTTRALSLAEPGFKVTVEGGIW